MSHDPGRLAFSTFALLATVVGCQVATGLSGFDTREDGGGGATSAVTTTTGGTQTTAATSTSATQDASTSGSTNASTGASVTILAEDLTRPTDVVLHDGTLYFLEQGEPGLANGRVWRVAPDGMSAPEAIVEHREKPRSLAVAGSTLYFIDETPNVVFAIDVDATPSDEPTVFANAFVGHPSNVAVDAEHVYWSTENGVRRSPFDGSVVEVITTTSTSWVDVGGPPSARGFASANGSVVSFDRVPLAMVDEIASRGFGVGALGRGPDHLLWTDGFAVRSYALADGNKRDLAAELSVVTRFAFKPGDATRPFWTTAKALRTRAFTEDQASDVSSEHQYLYGLALDATYTYATDMDAGDVLRIELPSF